MIFAKVLDNGIQKHLERNQKILPDILHDLIAQNSRVWQTEIKGTVLSGSVRGFGVDSGRTRAEGFKYVQHQRKRNGAAMESGYFWLRMANLYENFKTRRRVYLTRAAKRVFTRNATQETNYQNALERLARE